MMKKREIPVHGFPDNDFFMMGRIENSEDIRFTRTHRHSFYEILWFTEVPQNKTHNIDFETYRVFSNQVCILSPGQLHKIEFDTIKGYVVAFSPDFFHSVLGVSIGLFTRPYCSVGILPQSTAIILKKLISLIELEYKTAKRRKLLEAYFSAFLIHIQSLFIKQNPDNYSKKVVLVLDLIEKNFKQEKEVQFYARNVSLSVRRLNEMSVNDIGMTIKQLIVERLITEAKRLLYTESSSIKEIAYDLGYNDPAYFTRIFKKRTGLTPEKFREEYIR